MRASRVLAAVDGLCWLAAFCVLTQPGARSGILAAEQVSGAPQLGGTLNIQFDVHTRPGGESVRQGPALISPFNISMTVRAVDVRVNEDGTFAFEARGNYHLDYHAVSPGVTIDTVEYRADRVLGKGKVAENRSLSLDLAWGHGEGLQVWITNVGGSSARQPATEAVALPRWELTPASRQIEEPSPDCLRETALYKSSRPSTVVGTHTVPLIERIEVKHVRHLNLVPRG